MNKKLRRTIYTVAALTAWAFGVVLLDFDMDEDLWDEKP
jgi:uncharacterized membrane protein